MNPEDFEKKKAEEYFDNKFKTHDGSESTGTGGYVDFSAMADELTGVMGVGLYFIREAGKGVPHDEIDIEKWRTEYLGINNLPRGQVQLNTFKPIVDNCVASIMRVVEKYT